MFSTYHDRTFSDILIEEGLITPGELARVLGEREDLTEKEKARCLGKQMGIPFVDLAQREADPGAARLIPHRLALRLRALPIERSDTAVSVAMANPLDLP